MPGITPVGPLRSNANTWTQPQTLPLQDSGGQVYSAKAYGATGAGYPTDDYAAITAAMTAAAASGGIVRIPPGTYYSSYGLFVPSNVRIEGSGPSYTTLMIGSGSIRAGIQMAGVSNASVANLTVDLRTRLAPVNGITCELLNGTPCTYCTIENCRVLGYNLHQYLFWNQQGQHTTYINCTADGGVPIANISNVTVASNVVTITTTSPHGMSVGDNVMVTAITNTTVNGAAVIATVPTNTTLTYSKTVANASGTDTGTVIRASQQEGFESQGGIDVQYIGCRAIGVGNNAFNICALDISGSSINGVRIIAPYVNGAASGLNLQSSNATHGPQTVNDVILSCFQFSNIYLYGIQSTAVGGAGITSIIITDGTIENVGGLTNPQGIIFSGDSTIAANPVQVRNTQISHVVLKGITASNEYGLEIVNYPGVRVLDFAVEDIATAAGIFVYGSTDVIIDGARIDNTGTYAIWAQNLSHRLVIRNCILSNWNQSNTGFPAVQVEDSNYVVLIDNKGTSIVNDFYLCRAMSDCSFAHITRNIKQYISETGCNINLGTNPSTGTLTMTASQVSTTISNNYCRSSSLVRLVQIAGPPTAFRVSAADNSFTVTFAANATGTEQFQYWIDL